MTTKMTHRDYFNRLSAIVALSAENGLVSATESADLTAFINGRIEAIVKKNGAERKPTKTQTANVELSSKILSMMNVGQIYTATEIQKMLGVEQYTLPKVTALLRPMLTVTAKDEINPNGTIERFMEKGKAYFRKLDLPTDDEEVEED